MDFCPFKRLLWATPRTRNALHGPGQPVLSRPFGVLPDPVKPKGTEAERTTVLFHRPHMARWHNRPFGLYRAGLSNASGPAPALQNGFDAIGAAQVNHENRIKFTMTPTYVFETALAASENLALRPLLEQGVKIGLYQRHRRDPEMAAHLLEFRFRPRPLACGIQRGRQRDHQRWYAYSRDQHQSRSRTCRWTGVGDRGDRLHRRVQRPEAKLALFRGRV